MKILSMPIIPLHNRYFHFTRFSLIFIYLILINVYSYRLWVLGDEIYITLLSKYFPILSLGFILQDSIKSAYNNLVYHYWTFRFFF